MNIFVISRGYPNRYDPLWGSFEVAQAEALRNRGHKVTILAIDGRMRFYARKPGITFLKNEGCYIMHLFPQFIIKWWDSLSRKVYQKMMCRLFRKVVEREGMPDVVYAHYLNLMHSCLGIRKEFDGALIGLEHWSELMKENVAPYILNRAKTAYLSFDKILAVSPQLCRSLKQNLGVDAEFVPNIVAKEFLSGQPGKEKKASNRFEFCSIGRLVDWKNFDILIHATAILRRKGIDFGLNIIGDGPERKKLNDLIKEYCLQDRVQLLGTLRREKIIEILENSDAFVLASQHETFGVVFIEAMAKGLPVIAGNAGGPVDIIDETRGMLVELRNPEALADAMQKMIDRYGEYDRVTISADCASLYSGETVAKKLEGIFEETLKNKRMA